MIKRSYPNNHMHIYLFIDLSSSAPAETSGYIMNCMVTDKSLLFSL